MQLEQWQPLKEAVTVLLEAFTNYATYLKMKTKQMKEHHAKTILSDDQYTVKLLPVHALPNRRYHDLTNELQKNDSYIDVSNFAPDDRKARYRYLSELEMGLPLKAVLLTYSIGGNIPDYHFLWQANSSEEENLSRSNRFLQEIKDRMPTYHTRALKNHFIRRYGVFTNTTPNYILRDIYRELTNDASASTNLSASELDSRLKVALDAEDPDILVDLRSLNEDGSDRFSVFWEHMNVYLNDVTSVQERRQSLVGFMAVAVSTRDLIEQVSKLCPEGTPIPSPTWVRYQFHPKNPRSMAARKYRKRFNLRLMVQQRLLRAWHIDAHYCAAYLKYFKEYAVLHRERALFISVDDKHRLKIGEPGFPVAAVDRGKQVIVSMDSAMKVADHDFTKSSLIPSGQFIVDIPESSNESFHSGDVHIGLKDAAFESSSGMRHSAELYRTLVNINLSYKCPHHIHVHVLSYLEPNCYHFFPFIKKKGKKKKSYPFSIFKTQFALCKSFIFHSEHNNIKNTCTLYTCIYLAE